MEKHFLKIISEDDEETKTLNDEEEEISDEDECEYNPVTSVSEDVMNSIINEYKNKIKKMFPMLCCWASKRTSLLFLQKMCFKNGSSLSLG